MKQVLIITAFSSLFLSILSHSAFSQDKAIDAAMDSFYTYRDIDPSKSIQFIQLADSLVRNLDSLSVKEQIVRDTLIVSINYYTSKNLFFLGQFDKVVAYETFEQSKEKIASFLPSVYPEFLLLLSTAYSRIDRIKDAERILLECISWMEKEGLENNQIYAAALTSIGVAYMAQTRVKEAEKYLVKSQKLELKLEGAPLVATNNLGAFYLQLGNFDKAETLLNSIVDYFKSPSEELLTVKNTMLLNTLTNLSDLYDKTGRREKGLETDRLVLKITEEENGKMHPNYFRALNNLGTTLMVAEKFDEAFPVLQEAITLYKQKFGVLHRDYTSALGNLGRFYQRKGDFENAYKVDKEVLQLEREFLNPESNAFTLHLRNAADVCVILGKYDEALSLYQELNSYMINQLNLTFPLLSIEGQYKYFQNIKYRFYAQYSFFRMVNKEMPEVLSTQYDLHLTIKSILLDASTKIQQSIYSSQDSMLIKEFQQLSKLRNRYAGLYKYPDSVLKANNVDINLLETSISELESSINRQVDLEELLDQKGDISWKDIQAKLQSNEAAIEIIKAPLGSFEEGGIINKSFIYEALIITSSSEYPIYVKIGNSKEIETYGFSAYKRDLKEKILESESYNIFWNPIKEELQGIQKVYISLDGVYHGISLNSLYNSKTQTYLGDEIDLVLLNSTREILNKSSSATNEKGVYLLGAPTFSDGSTSLTPTSTTTTSIDTAGTPLLRSTKLQPLPGAKKEIMALDTLFSNQQIETTIWIEAEANETNIKSVARPRVIHIASHGFFETSKSKSSNTLLANAGIYLSGAQNSISDTIGLAIATEGKNDGIFTALEAMNLDLDGTELITLSACDSGLGTLRNGEGVYGLQRAFTIAGAQNILMSLWKVDDEVTKDLMKAFYAAWLNGYSKSQALKSAQQKIREQYPHPYYWGGFVLVGNN